MIEAQYGDLVSTTSFEIVDDLKDGATVSLDKEIYGLDETVFLTGLLPTSDRAVDISLMKPDGSVSNSGAAIDNQRFSWEWNTPITESQKMLKVDENQRDSTSSNIGLYKIHVSSSTYGKDLFFKVSLDPENDSLNTDPLFVTTEKSISDTLSESDAVILITGHKEFQNLDLKKFSKTMKNSVLIDCTGLVKPLDAKENGFIFRGIGRGDI